MDEIELQNYWNCIRNIPPEEWPQSREEAEGRNLPFFMGRPCRRDHQKRYVTSGMCIDCGPGLPPPPSEWHLLPKTPAEAWGKGETWFYGGSATRSCRNGHPPWPRRAEWSNRKNGPNGKSCEECARGYNRNAARIQWNKGIHSKQIRERFRPPWQPKEEVRKFCEDDTPLGMEVDHIVPFHHDNKEVIGLHVIHNLEYITRGENAGVDRSKLPEGLTPEEAVARGMAIWRRKPPSEDLTPEEWEEYRPEDESTGRADMDEEPATELGP